ncbi:MAG: hypothetical protein AB1772_03170 [Candidatus Zixiibacteriota bacterium]
MFTMNPVRIVLVIGCTILAVVGSYVPAGAGTFVSYNGKFHFVYPESWIQVDYTTAEVYLTRGDPEKEVDFEAVFSETKTYALFQGLYLILTVDTVGQLLPEQIDSVVNTLTREFRRPIKEVTPDAFLAAPCRDSIVFDREGGRVSIESEVPGDRSGPRTNLLAMKFYEHGIANFYFYAPSAEYAGGLPILRHMVMSLSIGETPPAVSAEPVKVADIGTDGKKARNYGLYFGGPLFIIFVIVIVRLRKKKAQRKL